MLDIHFGVRAEDFDAFKRIIEREFEGVEVSTNNQDWNTWAPFTEEPKDEDILHVTISTLIPRSLSNYLIGRMGVFLNPLSDIESAFYNRFLITTDHEHWNQYFVELSYPE